MIAVGLAVLVVAALCGAPLFVVILAGAMLGFLAADIELYVVAIELFKIADTPLLVALPLFTFAGYILAEANTSQRLMDVTRSLFGWMPAGLAIVGFATCAFFTALTGASGVTIVALGALLLPMLVKSGYTEKFSLGLVTTSGSLGVLIVPSVPLILYGIVAQQIDVGEPFTIQELFLAGLVPALLMILALSVYAVVRHGSVERTSFNAMQVWRAIVAAKWEIPLPFFILGGIYTGIFAVSEAAALTAMYALIVEVFVYKEVSFKKLPVVIRDSMIMVGCIILILGTALALMNYFVDQQLPQRLFQFINAHISNPYVFLILLNLLLLFLGTILDIFAAIVIMVPLLLPVAVAYGIHPVHLGVIFIANLQIGYFTPPIGMNLFIASYRFNKPIIDLYAASLPFMAVLLLVLIAITYIPFLSMWYQFF